MPIRPSRTALLGYALAPVVILGVLTPGIAKDAQPATPETVEASAKPATAPVPASARLPGDIARPTPPRTGGTAVINFVAYITPKTMADLARNAQNAVISGADSIRINISSGGGSVTATQFAMNVIRTLPVPVETAAMSHIASAAVALFCMGEKRYMGEGTTLYLHQQIGHVDMQDKSAEASTRRFALNTDWYDTILGTCVDEDADRTALDYSSRDSLIDVAQATAMGMVTGPIEELRNTKAWGMVINVTAPEPHPGAGGYPVYR